MQQLQKTTLTSLLAHYEPLVIAGLVFVAHLVLRAADRILVGAFNDDGAYVALGQALAGGVGYRLIYLVGDPVAVKYPPGLPLLIAVPWKLFGTLAGVRATIGLLNPLASGAAAGIIWWIGRRRLDAAPAVLGLCALGPFFLDAVIQYFNIPLSEPYFVCGWATALLLTYRMADAGPGAARPALAATLGLVLALTALFRTAGVVLLVAVLVALVLERRPWREVALCAGVALVPLAVWYFVHAAAVARGPLAPLPDETPYWRWLPLDRPSQLLSYAARGLGINGLGYMRYLSGYLAPSHVVGPTLASGAGPRPENRSPLYVLAGNSRYIFGVVQWVRANTTPHDRIMADAPAAVYLYTARKTAAAAPAEPAFAPSVFQVPGRYLATRILEDSLTVIVLGIAGSRLEEDIRAVASVCPRVLQRPAGAAGALPAFYRVVRDDKCLRERVLSPSRE